MISDSTTHVKMACGAPEAAFRVALLDSELTLSQPAAVTAAAGFDAIAHAVETAVTTRRTEMSTLFSRGAFRLLNGHYERVLSYPNDLEARGAMQLGAFYAGAAIEHSMLGAAHACANPLTAQYQITHGVALAILLPHVVRWNATANSQLYRSFVDDAMDGGVGGPSGDQLAARLVEIGRAGGLPDRLRDTGVGEDALETLAEAAAQQWTRNVQPQTVQRPGGPGGVSMRVLESHWLTTFLLMLIFFATPAVAAQDAAPTSPEESWSQFRGTPELSGVSASSVPDTLELLWTLDVGESIDSSAAIVDGTVYVGTYLGELVAVDLHSGSEKWRYQASEDMGNRRVVSGCSRRPRLRGRPRRCPSRGRRGKRHGQVDLRDHGRDQVITRGGWRPRADRILRWVPVRVDRGRWLIGLEARDPQLRARHAGRGRRGRVLRWM